MSKLSKESFASMSYQDKVEILKGLGIKYTFQKEPEVETLILDWQEANGDIPDSVLSGEGSPSTDSKKPTKKKAPAKKAPGRQKKEVTEEEKAEIEAKKLEKEEAKKKKAEEKANKIAERKTKAEKNKQSKALKKQFTSTMKEFGISSDEVSEVAKVQLALEENILTEEEVEELRVAASENKRLKPKVVELTEEQKEILSDEQLSKSDKMRKLFDAGLESVADISKVLSSHYSFAFNVISTHKLKKQAVASQTPSPTTPEEEELA